jgi:hypothetical protein
MKLSTSACLLLMSAAFGSAACSSDNSPSMTANGGSPASAGGSTASGGSSSSLGGAATAAGGATSSGGATVSSGGAATGENFSPSCEGLTAGGVEIKKGGACSATDPQVCYKTCGPGSVGFKSETCTSGLYAEGDCAFPAAGNYACYKIPATIDHAACGTATPKASSDCTVAECTLCNDANGTYFDSGGNSKAGYCVCPAASASGTRHWTCASATAWPCPLGQGC